MIDVCNVVCSKTKYNKQAVISSTDSTDSNGPEASLYVVHVSNLGHGP